MTNRLFTNDHARLLISWNRLNNCIRDIYFLFIIFRTFIIIEAVGTISNVFNIRCNVIDPIYYVTSDVLNVIDSSLSCFVDPLSYILFHIIDPSNHVFSYFFEEVAICKVVSPFTNIFDCITDKSFNIIHDSIDELANTVCGIIDPFTDILNNIES